MLIPNSGSKKKITYSCKTSGVPRTISTYQASGVPSARGPYMRPNATVNPIKIASGIAVTDNFTVIHAAANNNGKRCLKWWVESGAGCGRCTAVCPYAQLALGDYYDGKPSPEKFWDVEFDTHGRRKVTY